MTEKAFLYIKHNMSCLRDQRMEVEIDCERRAVVLTMDVFDSALVVDAVTRKLLEFGVSAYRDDKDKVGTAWLTPAAAYRLFVVIAGVRYRAQVVRFFDSTDYSLTLTPAADDH